jgi:RNA polymerase sigma-70 factor (ECF subfamily)
MRDGQATTAGSDDESRLVAGLREGDETTFTELIEMHGEAMLRIATGMVASPALAEDVVQETWLAVFTGIHRFERRSSVRTWIFRILMNTANTHRMRDARSIPFADLRRELSIDQHAVEPERFLGGGDGRGRGRWSAAPQSWNEEPEARLLSGETFDVIRRTIDTLPPGQRAVVILRDVQGWNPDEVSEALGVSRGNQRVLLHRARGRLRAALESWMWAASPRLPSAAARAENAGPYP